MRGNVRKGIRVEVSKYKRGSGATSGLQFHVGSVFLACTVVVVVIVLLSKMSK